MVIFEERRTRKSDERRIRQSQAHVARKLASLRAMRLVGDHDNIVPVTVRLGNVLVEFVYEAENKAMILAQQFFKVFTRFCPRRLFVCHTATHKGSENLVIEILSIRHE